MTKKKVACVGLILFLIWNSITWDNVLSACININFLHRVVDINN